jgi:hypothetical protein
LFFQGVNLYDREHGTAEPPEKKGMRQPGFSGLLGSHRESERERESVCVYVCMCVCLYV